MPTELTPTEVERYEFCKKQIADGLKTVFEVGGALTEIRDGKLYREDFPTFVEFCEENYHIGKSRAYQLIEAAEVKASVKSTAAAEEVTNEGQARELGKVPAADRGAVVEDLVREGKLVTGKSIADKAEKKAKAEAKPDPAMEIRLDKTGYPIPVNILSLWDQATDEGKEQMRKISEVKCKLQRWQKDESLIHVEMNFDSTLSHLESSFLDLKRTVPFAICTSCHGRTPTKCTFCEGRGYISQFAYETQVPREAKEIRAKIAIKA